MMRSLLTVLLLATVFSLPASGQQRETSQRFDRFDRNSDGSLTPDELPFERLFSRLDSDRDGLVSRVEAQALDRRSTPSITPRTLSPSSPKQDSHDQDAGAANLDPAVLRDIDAAMQTAIDNGEVSGIVGLLHRDGKRAYFEAFGRRDIEAAEAMPLDAIFRLQSMSKPVVTVAALVLYEAGKLDLDAPIAELLPEWDSPNVLEDGELVPARTRITPRMLMSHSSGLHYGSLPGYPTPRRRAANLDGHSKMLASRPLKFHPGEDFQYGTSIDVLGRYCEVVAGKPLDDVVKETVLVPLGMTDTDFWVPPAKEDRIAQIYARSQAGGLQRGREASLLTTKPTMFLGGQGLCSTAADYERFCLMLLNGGELDGVGVLKPATVDMIFTNQLSEIGQRYGLGGSVDGDGGYAWGGANGTQFWIDRKNRMVGIFMIQAQRYRPPTFKTFRSLAREAIVAPGA